MRFLPDRFSLITAWRDARSQWKSLLTYSSGIIAGVAALVAILSFRSDVFLTVNEQAKELLGADLQIAQNSPFDEIHTAFFDSLGGEQSRKVEFSSMVVYGAQREVRLSQIRAIEGGFPFYGRIKTDPPEAADTYQQNRTALVDRPIMVQFGLQPGDSIRVGNEMLEISGVILDVPGESAAVSLIGPRVIVGYDVVEGSGLLQRGSRVRHTVSFRFEEGRDFAGLMEVVRPFSRAQQLSVTTVESRKEDFRAIVDNLTRFLGMIGFIALLLGGLGVAGAIYVYIKRKSGVVATLRCMGASSRQTITIFAVQVLALGLAGALAGSLLGVLIQQYLPLLFTGLLPFEIVQQVSLSSIGMGLGIGLFISLGFALLPLASINNIPPLLTIRSMDYSPFRNTGLFPKLMLGGVAIAMITISLAILLENALAAVLFTVGMIFSILILMVTARLLIGAVKRLRLPVLPYVWRQGTANLFRPNNQTALLVTTLGMGMLIIGTLYLSKEMILDRIDFQSGENQPNLVFYDVQEDQNEDIIRIIGESGATVLENVPIVTMRLAAINGRPVREIREDTASTESRWALTREYRVTYREDLNDAEKVVEGKWIGKGDGIGSVVPVSLGMQLVGELNVGLGDRLTFDVQGIPVETEIASIREIDFQRPQPNFFLVFPAGVLEPAPKFYATVVRTSGSDETAALQQKVVSAHPNISAIDIGLVLESVQAFLDKIALAVQFMALFSIVTGLFVLASAIAISRYQRVKEAVLLRTMGASGRQVTGIQLVEYLLTGILACLTGLLLALGAGWLLAWFYFDLVFMPNVLALLIASGVVILLILLTGYLNTKSIGKRKPLEMLRMETG